MDEAENAVSDGGQAADEMLGGVLIAGGVRVIRGVVNVPKEVAPGMVGVEQREAIIFDVQLGAGGNMPVAFPLDQFKKAVYPALQQMLDEPTIHRASKMPESGPGGAALL